MCAILGKRMLQDTGGSRKTSKLHMDIIHKLLIFTKSKPLPYIKDNNGLTSKKQSSKIVCVCKNWVTIQTQNDMLNLSFKVTGWWQENFLCNNMLSMFALSDRVESLNVAACNFSQSNVSCINLQFHKHSIKKFWREE